MVLSDKFGATRFWHEIKKYQATQFNYLGAVIPILEKQPEKRDDLDNPAKSPFVRVARRRSWIALKSGSA